MAGEPLKHKVLIVDDETINIQMIGNVLREYMSVIFATSGEDALTIARANNPDMILLDIVMPGMDGYEVCTALKSDPATEHIPIIFVTAENTPEDEARGLSLGAIDFITKPFNPETLKVKVLNQLKQLESSARSRPAVAAPPAPQPAAPQPAAAAGLVLIPEPVKETPVATRAPAAPPPPERAGQPATAANPVIAPAAKPPAANSRGANSVDSNAPLPKKKHFAEVLGYGWILTSKCQSSPKVDWWLHKSNLSIAGYVRKKYKGNWNRYADIWNRRLANLQRIQNNGNTAVLNNGISLKDAELVNYIEKMEQRVGVIYCLGKEASAVQASGK